MGVEPTRERIAPPTGFEARPPHQGRFSSLSCALFIDRRFAGYAARGRRRDIERKQIFGAHEMLVVHAPRETDAIEEFENLDRAFASEAGGIAKRGRAHFTVNLVQAVGRCRQPANRHRMEEEEPLDQYHLSTRGGANHSRAHQRFRLRGTLRQIAHPWWIEW